MNWQCAYCKYTTSYYLLEKSKEVSVIYVLTPYIRTSAAFIKVFIVGFASVFMYTSKLNNVNMHIPVPMNFLMITG